MPELPKEATAILYAQGFAGVVILGLVCAVLALAYALVKLYGRNQELNETLKQIGSESVKANFTVAASLDKLSDRLTDLLWRSAPRQSEK